MPAAMKKKHILRPIQPKHENTDYYLLTTTYPFCGWAS